MIHCGGYGCLWALLLVHLLEWFFFKFLMPHGRDFMVLLKTLEEDGPSLSPEFDSIVEVHTTETAALIESCDVHLKPESVASSDAENKCTGAENMENIGCLIRRVEGGPAKLSASRTPSFRTVPANTKVESLLLWIPIVRST